jgi:thioredoxin 1
MEPIVKELEAEFPGQVQKVNIEEDQTTTEKFSIMSIPTFLIEEDGREVTRIVGQTN